MADLDIKKNAETIADLFVSFFEQFVHVLTKPKTAISTIFYPASTSRKRLQTSIVFSASSVLLGIAFARFVELPGSPAAVNPETAIAVLLVWIFSAMILHPMLKLFKAKGGLQDTIVVFLLVISSLHLVFIAVLSAASRVFTDTEVTLTYDYVVYFGVPSKENRLDEYSHLAGEIGRIIPHSGDWRSELEGRYKERFIKGKEPDRDRTILPPAQALDDIRDISDLPMRPEQVKRLCASAAPYEPHRTEKPVLAGGYIDIVFGIWLFCL